MFLLHTLCAMIVFPLVKFSVFPGDNDHLVFCFFLNWQTVPYPCLPSFAIFVIGLRKDDLSIPFLSPGDFPSEPSFSCSPLD